MSGKPNTRNGKAALHDRRVHAYRARTNHMTSWLAGGGRLAAQPMRNAAVKPDDVARKLKLATAECDTLAARLGGAA